MAADVEACIPESVPRSDRQLRVARVWRESSSLSSTAAFCAVPEFAKAAPSLTEALHRPGERGPEEGGEHGLSADSLWAP